MMIKSKIYYMIFLAFISFALSIQNEYLPVELLIDPATPDALLVQKFQEKYMDMDSMDSGYGSFGPKTTKKWKMIISNPATYNALFDLAVTLKEESKFQDSNMILHYLIDGHYPLENIKIKSKFLRAQIFYDLSYFEEAIFYFKVLLSENLDDEYRKKSLFMIAYICNNNLDMYTDALDFYSQFLIEYENDDLVASVKYEIEQINNILVKVKD